MHKIAIILPVYNAEKYLPKTLEAIASQEYTNWHLVAVDDGSSDESVRILNTFKGDHPNVEILRTPNSKHGPSVSRNIAIEWILKEGTCEFTAFCDSDDVWTPDHLTTSLAFIGDSGMVYSDCDFAFDDGEPAITYGVPYYDFFNRDNLIKQNFIYISTVLMKTSCLKDLRFDKDSVPMEDWDMWLRVSKSNSIFHIPKKMTTYTYKRSGSYYSAAESEKAKIRVIIKNAELASTQEALAAQLEFFRQLKTDIIKMQFFEGAAYIRDIEKRIMAVMVPHKDPETIEGWLTVKEGSFLKTQAIGKNCLEIGSFKGKSAAWIASAAKSLVCVDPFRADWTGQNQSNSHTTLQTFLENTSTFSNITPVVGTSENVSHIFAHEHFDMIFVDGMHDELSVKKDIDRYWPKLKPGGRMMFHDYGNKDFPGVKKAVDAFSRVEELHDTIAAITKSDIVIDPALDIYKDKDLFPEKTKSANEMLEKVGLPKLMGKIVAIAPFSTKLPGVLKNPKNFPVDRWKQVVAKLKDKGCHVVQIGVRGEELIDADEVFFNLNFAKLKELLDQSHTFISVDSFFPHFAKYHKKRGVVIFSQSDPKIFGYPENCNLLKSDKYLRDQQFQLWTQTSYNEDAFVDAEEVIVEVEKILSSLERNKAEQNI